MKLDFSQFHPLDHWAGDRRCWSLPGGPVVHIKYWWNYQGPGWHPEDWEDWVDVTDEDELASFGEPHDEDKSS